MSDWREGAACEAAFARYNTGVLRARQTYQEDPFAGSREIALDHIQGHVISGMLDPHVARAMRREVERWVA